MTEYIEHEKVYEMLNALGGCGAEPESWADGWDKAFDEAIRELDNIPAADVCPERHGEWLVSGECYECSECGGGSTVNTNPYCWKCGAKMDGKDGDSG